MEALVIRNRKGVAALRWHEPKLVPLLPQIRRVHDSLTVRREIRPRLPVSLLVVDFACLSAGFCFHPPEAAGAVGVAAIGNEQQLFSVRRPRRADLVVKLAVVVTRQVAASFAGEALHIAKFAVSELA